MALPKQVKDKVQMMALKEAVKSDFGSDEYEPKEMEMSEGYKCPKCGHSGSKEEFEVESD